MTWTSLEAISPIDGRYEGKTADFKPFFSEKALIQYRIRIEIEYFIALSESEVSQVPTFSEEDCTFLRAIYKDMTLEDAQRVKDIEKVTNHDVKAVEYFIKEKLQGHKLEANKEFIHFGLTSQDINNTATPLLLKEAFETAYLPKLDEVISTLEALAGEWKDISMLAKTHGQPASPTRLGKEVNVFVARLKAQREQLLAVPFSAKFGGATGNFNAHHIAFPEVNWLAFGNKFVEETLGLRHSFPTTQIEHYDNLAAFFDACKRINTILIDLDRDMWTYISMEYFKQKIKKGEIGSSAMPHKVNPIDFENSEGNLGIANALFEHLSGKLPISRLQRDLTDSTVLRNIGVPMAHTTLAFQALLKGLNKLLLNEAAIDADLEKNWAVVAEAVQTVLRREAYPNPYEALKELTRTNEAITQSSIAQFIDTLEVSEELKAQLKTITPQNFTGI